VNAATIDRLLSEIRRLTEALQGARDRAPEGDEERSRWLAGLLAHSPDRISILDLDGRISYLSRVSDGRDPSVVYGVPAVDLVAAPARAAFRTAFELAIASGEPQTLELPSDGATWWQVRLAPIRSHDSVTCVLSIASDVTARKRTEEALEATRQELELALDASKMGLWRWRVGSDTVVWDDVTKEVFGWTGDGPVTYSRYLDRCHPDDREYIRAHVARAIETGTYDDLEHRVLLPGGEVRWVFAKGRVLKDSAGVPTDLIGGMLDITRRRELEANTRRIEKLEAIGQLAAGVAHDFNNLLVAITGNVDLARECADPAQRAELLEGALEASTRAAELTRQLLTFGRKQATKDVALDVNDVIGDTLKLLRRLIPENIRVDYVPGHQLPRVLGDRGQIEQVLVNLAVNARDAMPDGGTLLLETETVLINGRYRESHPWARPGRYVLLTLTDTGVGIPPDHIDRVFLPFFTTKAHGTGLGLSTVYGIVKAHAGLVHVYSEIGKGTTFKVYLPAAERHAAEVGSKIEPRPVGGDETVLVAEDEPSVRAIVVRMLKSAGYRVIVAEDGEEAVQLFRARSGEIDAVLVDAIMPRKGGAEAIAEIRAIDPDMVAILSSGYAESIVAQGGAAPGVEFLPKPYLPDQLLRCLRRALAQRAAQG
jgi:two-component system cell cycle sensor histidine kinase/response regulator CckA